MPVDTSKTKLVSLRVPHHIWSDIVDEASRRGTTRTQEMIRRLGQTRDRRTGHDMVEAAVAGVPSSPGAVASTSPTDPTTCAHSKVKVLGYGVFCADCGQKMR